MHVLVTGGTGLLGINWCASIADTHQVTLGVHRRVVDFPAVGIKKLSFESFDSFLRDLDDVRPDCVVHAAALTNIDVCEQNPELAFRVNVEIAGIVARACALRGIRLAHISTDHLFLGDRQFLDERASVDPVNIYGKTKAEAEVRVRDIYPQALVIRTNFFGWGPRYRRSFSDWVYDNLKQNRPITLFNDVFYTPIYIGRLVQTVHKLVEGTSTGIFHVVGDERVSKYDFAMELASLFGLDRGLLSYSSVHSQKNRVVRPKDMSLSNKKVSKELNINVGGITEHLLHMKRCRFTEIENI